MGGNTHAQKMEESQTVHGSVDDGKALTFAGDHTFTGDLAFEGALASGVGGGGDPEAVVFGAGTSALPVTTATAGDNGIELRFESTATDAGSDTRAEYLALYLAGATTGGGDCLRAVTHVEANLGTARGAHLSLDFSAVAGGSECSGLGAAVVGTTHIPDVASWAPGGTLCSMQAEIYSDGSASDPAGLTELSVLRLANSGNATGMADVDTDAMILSIQGFTAAADTTKAISSTSLAELPAGTVGIRVKVGTGVFYIPAVAIAEWD